MGYVFLINNGAVSWRATRTPLVTLNSAESEVIALSAATQEAVYLRKLANELGFTQVAPTPIYEDCTAAVALSKENRFRNRWRHIALRWAYVSERQSPAFGDIEVISVSRTIMLADIFASPRPAASLVPFRDTILGGRDNDPSTKEDAPAARFDQPNNKLNMRLPLSTLLLFLILPLFSSFLSHRSLARRSHTIQASMRINATISLDAKDTVLDQMHLRPSRARRSDELANFKICDLHEISYRWRRTSIV